MNTEQNNKSIEDQNRIDLDKMMKSGDAFRFVSPFERSKAYEETGDGGETNKYVELYASSDQEDLVGDVMDLTALEDMERTAVGTIMLRDHNPSTEKIFGWIVEARLEQKDGANLLWIKALVDDGDNQNVRIWKSIKNGVKLGASVTVLITKKAANPRRKGSLIIKNVLLLEISIVTIPCNQQSWTLAASASKALRRAEEAMLSNQDTETKEKTMSDKKETVKKGGAPEGVETNEPAVAAGETQISEDPVGDQTVETVTAPTESKGFFARTLAAIQATLAAKKAFDDQGTKPEIREISVKGMFNVELEKRKPSLWDLFDILCTVKWQLMDRKWAIEWTDLEDDFDYVGEFRTACEEFASAAVESFAYYGGFETGAEDASADTATADTVSNALEVEKSFKILSEAIKEAKDENVQKQLREIGASMLEVAKSAGILFPDANPAEGSAETVPAAELTEEEIRKSTVFTEIESRAQKAESDLAKANEDLEIAKAGLEAANAALQMQLRQPLVFSDPKTAASS